MTELCAFCGSILDGHPGELHDVVIEGSIFLDLSLVDMSIGKGGYCDFRCLYGRLQERVSSMQYGSGE